MTLLLVFGGLPGSGKSVVSGAVADALGATWIRVDSIEAALARCALPVGARPAGYAVGNALAADQLRAGRPVVIDAVNGLRVARSGWIRVAVETGAQIRFAEVRCSDPDEHRRRVEERRPDIPGLVLPTWDQVRDREWEPWDEQRLIVDNDGAPKVAVAQVLAWLAKGGLYSHTLDSHSPGDQASMAARIAAT